MPFNSSSVALDRQRCIDVGGFPDGVTRGGDIMMWVRMGLRYPIAYSPSRQVIYHTDAVDRACDKCVNNEESAIAREISKLLSQQEVPAGIADDLREYYALLNIRKSKEILLSGNPVGARELLNKARKTRNHRKECLWWLFWSCPLPSLILPSAIKLYSGLRKIA